LAILFLVMILLWQGRRWLPARQTEANPAVITDLQKSQQRLVYTRHARCRMACRGVTEAEVEGIWRHGAVNARKSNPQDQPCPTWALEGYAADRQHLRIVFATCGNEIKVITCIDLERDFSCSCP
jgi:uncharacterized DUF497 family protein